MQTRSGRTDGRTGAGEKTGDRVFRVSFEAPVAHSLSLPFFSLALRIGEIFLYTRRPTREFMTRVRRRRAEEHGGEREIEYQTRDLRRSNPIKRGETRAFIGRIPQRDALNVDSRCERSVAPRDRRYISFL